MAYQITANPTIVSAFYDEGAGCFIGTTSDGGIEEIPVRTVSALKVAMKAMDRVVISRGSCYLVRPKLIHAAAVEILRQTVNPAVGFGDSHLLHEINNRMGRKPDGYKTEKKVLDALSRDPGILRPVQSKLGANGQYTRRFYLPEHYPYKD